MAVIKPDAVKAGLVDEILQKVFTMHESNSRVL